MRSQSLSWHRESTTDINDNISITFSPLSSLALRNMVIRKRFAASFHPVKMRGGNRATEGAARSRHPEQQPEKRSPVEQANVWNEDAVRGAGKGSAGLANKNHLISYRCHFSLAPSLFVTQILGRIAGTPPPSRLQCMP